MGDGNVSTGLKLGFQLLEAAYLCAGLDQKSALEFESDIAKRQQLVGSAPCLGMARRVGLAKLVAALP